MDDAERARLAVVAVRTLEGLTRFWRHRVSRVTDGVTGKRAGAWRTSTRSAGFESARLAPLCRDVAEEVFVGLDALGVVVPAAERARLLAS